MIDTWKLFYKTDTVVIQLVDFTKWQQMKILKIDIWVKLEMPTLINYY